MSLTGAFIDIARISRDGCITPGDPAVRWPQGAHGLQKGTFALDQGSHRLISLKGAPAGDRVLIGALIASKELSFLQEAPYVNLRVFQKYMLLWRSPFSMSPEFLTVKHSGLRSFDCFLKHLEVVQNCRFSP